MTVQVHVKQSEVAVMKDLQEMIYRKFSILLFLTRYYMMDLHNSYRPCKGRAAKEKYRTEERL